MEQAGRMSIKKFNAVKIEAGHPSDVTDALTVEAPLQIKINDKAFTVTMRTPGDDPFLVKGLLFTEGVVSLEGLDYPFSSEPDREHPENTIVNIEIPEIFICEDLLEKRALISSSSCGMCGKKELADISIDGDRLVPGRPLEWQRLESMAVAMREHQRSFQETGGCHAAAVFTMEGDLICHFEDVGRHNAVDKIVGCLIDENRLDEAAAIFVSGRISYEIVSKAYRAGLPFLIAVSAPSSMAVEMGERLGMSIMGFCRDDRCTVYSHPEHVKS